jgi:hypothetical protein
MQNVFESLLAKIVAAFESVGHSDVARIVESQLPPLIASAVNPAIVAIEDRLNAELAVLPAQVAAVEKVLNSRIAALEAAYGASAAAALPQATATPAAVPTTGTTTKPS